MKIRQKVLKKSFLYAFILSILACSAFSIGFSPPRFVIEVLPGSVLEETVAINLLEVESGVIYVSVDGDAKEWIQHPSRLLVPDDQDILNSNILIHVPSTTTVGNYSATIHYLIPGRKSVDLAFSIPIQLIVTQEENVEYALRNLKAVQEDNLSFSFTLYNKGNAAFGPTGAVVTVMDNLKKNVIYKGVQEIERVKAFTTETVLLESGVSLPYGYYWVDFSIPKYGYEESVFLEVEEARVETAVVQESGNDIDPFVAIISIVIIGFILVLILVTHISRMRRKKKRSKKRR